MNLRDKLMKARFFLNMERISGLCKLTLSDVDVLKPTGLFRSEGPRADILRAIVVFLHATFEDVLRGRTRPDNKKFTFNSGTDIDKALRKGGLDPAPFKSLYPPLSQMAKRRNRIVHGADLPKKTDITPEIWALVDDWQLLMWMAAVGAFHSRLCMSIDDTDQTARETYSKFRGVMDGLVDLGNHIKGFAETPKDMRTKALQNFADAVNRVSSLLDASKNDKEANPTQVQTQGVSRSLARASRSRGAS